MTDNTIHYFYYEASTGRLMQTGTCLPQDIDIQTPPFPNWLRGIGTASLFDDYFSINDQNLKQYPQKPSNYHVFDYQIEDWVTSIDGLDLAKSDKKQTVNDLRAELSKSPIDYQGARYDADQQAIQNISSVLLLGDSSTIVWRDYDNINHVMSIADLQGLANAIKDRNSVLYATSWAIKEEIDSLTTIEAVDSYVIDFG